MCKDKKFLPAAEDHSGPEHPQSHGIAFHIGGHFDPDQLSSQGMSSPLRNNTT